MHGGVRITRQEAPIEFDDFINRYARCFCLLHHGAHAHCATSRLPKPRLLVAVVCCELDLRRPWPPASSMPKIIAHYQTENEPSGADRALQRTADLRFSDTRVVAHRDFNHAESGQGAFEDHLYRPAIGGLFERERA